MKLRLLLAASSCAFLVAACGGGGANPSLPATVAPPPDAPTQSMTVRARLAIPNGAKTVNARSHQYVSASTNGVKVVTFAHGDTQHATPLGTVITDVSSASKACTATASGRTCTVNLDGPAGSDDLVFSLYDTAPVSGAIPSSAHLLGTAGVTQTIAAGSANTVVAYVNGVISGLSGQASFLSVPADGASHSIGLTISPTDFGNNAVSGGANDPFANPITVALTEHGGSGHALLSLNGGAGASSVTVTKSNDTVAVKYDGKGAAGYYTTVTLSAAAVAGTVGATESAQISPLIVSSTSSHYAQATSSIALSGNGDFVPFTVSEAGAASPSFTFARGTHCPAIALLETMSSASFNVLALGVASTYSTSTGCSIVVSDGTVSVTLGVSNTYSHTCCAAAFTEYPVSTGAEVDGFTVGADGLLWFEEYGTGKIGKMPTSATPGSGAQITEFPPIVQASGGSNVGLSGMSVGPDGNVWFADCSASNSTNGKITTSGTVTTYPTTQQRLNDVAAGPDGEMWFSATSGSVVKISTSGTITPYVNPNGSSAVSGMTEGPDGNMWYTNSAQNQIGVITTSGVSNVYNVPTANSNPQFIVAGPDGAMWFTEANASQIGRITTSGAVTEYPTLTPNVIPATITVGSDGALWFGENISNGKIGRITTAGAVSEYTPPSTTYIWGVASGPDGAIWFGECSSDKIGRLAF